MTKTPEPGVLQGLTELSVSLMQEGEVSVDNFCQKLLLYKIQAGVSRKAVLQSCSKSGWQDRGRTGRKKPCKVWKSRFVTAPCSHWHCQGHNFNREVGSFPQVEGLSYPAAWARVTCTLGMRRFKLLPQFQILLCHRVPIKKPASLSCLSLQGKGSRCQWHLTIGKTGLESWNELLN